VLPDPPIWKQPAYAEYIDIAKTAGKYLLMALALFILYTKAAKPLLKKLSEVAKLPPPSQNLQLQHAPASHPGQRSNYQENLTRAQSLANQDPRVVANIVKTWVGSNE